MKGRWKVPAGWLALWAMVLAGRGSLFGFAQTWTNSFLAAPEPPSVSVPIVVERGGGPWGPPASAGAGEDELFLRGLRHRGLYELAESHCRRILAAKGLDLRKKTVITVELALTLADRACLRPEERERLFKEAQKLLAGLEGELADTGLGLLVRFEEARLYSVWALAEKEERYPHAKSSAEWQVVHELLKQAVDILDKLVPAVEEAIRKAGTRSLRSPEVSGELSVYQLAELQKAALFEKGLCLLALGETFPDQSFDQVAYLAQAEQIFAQLATLPDDHPWAWPSRLAQVQALRLLRNFDEAEVRLSHWEKSDPPGHHLPALKAERLRLLVAKGQVDEASQLAFRVGTNELAQSAELALAKIEVLLAAWRVNEKSTGKADVGRFSEEIRFVLSHLAAHHSKRDLRRARSLVARQMPELAKDDLAIAEQAAEHAFLAGQYGQALAAYDHTVELALKSGHTARAWELALVAANIAATGNRPLAACGRYRALALWQPEHPKAAEIHLLAISEAAKLLGKLSTGAPSKSVDRPPSGETPDAGNGFGPLAPLVNAEFPEPRSPGEVLALCLQLVDEHLENWQGAPSAETVRIVRVQLLKETGQLLQAAEALADISPNSPQFRKAVDEFRDLFTLCSGKRSGFAESVDLAKLAAVGEKWLSFDPSGLSQEHLSAWLEAGLVVARVYLAQMPPQSNKAEAVLARIVGLGEKIPPAVGTEIQCLLLASCFWEGRGSEAVALAKQLAEQSPAELTVVASQLWDRLLAQGSSGDELRYRVFLEVTNLLRKHAPDAELKQKADLLWLRANVYTGGSAEAIAEARRLLANRPDDQEVTQLLARLLLAQIVRQLGAGHGQLSAEGVKEARQLWRKIESQATPYSDHWFQAKAALALLAVAEGNRAQAEKIARLARMLDPKGQGLKHPAVGELLRSLPSSAGALVERLIQQ